MSVHFQMNQITLAESLATKAHAGQFRRDKITPYITHPAAVAKKLEHEPHYVVATAWLHDVIEDTSVTLRELEEAGIRPVALSAIDAITRRKDEAYPDYMARVRENAVATRVKIMDMLHNLGDSPSSGQVSKYAAAIEYLIM